MYDIQKLDYNGLKVRMTQINGKRWYALSDIVKKVLGYSQPNNYAKKFKDSEKKKISVLNPNSFGGVKMYFISEECLFNFLENSGRPESDDFKDWLANNFDLDLSEVQSNSPNGDLSIQAKIQKAQMLIRIAEHKALPQNEQLRLLEMAVQELTGMGLKVPQIELQVNENIMDLPEVVGFIHEKKTENVHGCSIDFLPAELMAEKWRNPDINDSFNAEDFNVIADENGYKTERYGFWQKVTTPDGAAREFMYVEGSMFDYLRRKHWRAA